jgi:hypothetical protein
MATKFSKIQNGKGPQFVFTFQWKALNSINGDSPIVKMDGWEDDPQSEVALEIGYKKMCDYNPKKDGVSAISHLEYVEWLDDDTLRLCTTFRAVNPELLEGEMGDTISKQYQSVIFPYIQSMVNEIGLEPKNLSFEYDIQKLNIEGCDNQISTSINTAKQQFNFTNKFGNINLQ